MVADNYTYVKGRDPSTDLNNYENLMILPIMPSLALSGSGVLFGVTPFPLLTQ
jgi:hypothetical protein